MGKKKTGDKISVTTLIFPCFAPLKCPSLLLASFLFRSSTLKNKKHARSPRVRADACDLHARCCADRQGRTPSPGPSPVSSRCHRLGDEKERRRRQVFFHFADGVVDVFRRNRRARRRVRRRVLVPVARRSRSGSLRWQGRRQLGLPQRASLGAAPEVRKRLRFLFLFTDRRRRGCFCFFLFFSFPVARKASNVLIIIFVSSSFPLLRLVMLPFLSFFFRSPRLFFFLTSFDSSLFSLSSLSLTSPPLLLSLFRSLSLSLSTKKNKKNKNQRRRLSPQLQLLFGPAARRRVRVRLPGLRLRVRRGRLAPRWALCRRRWWGFVQPSVLHVRGDGGRVSVPQRGARWGKERPRRRGRRLLNF